MQFKRTEELKRGMRLARPIYNKNGVLLYERNSKLTEQGIVSIKNFGMIGIYILEPAEPVPPMTEEDIEFERFQTIHVFAIQDEIEKILATGKSSKLQVITANISKSYGHLDNKIHFIQSLRNREDFLYRHALNTAILSAVLSNRLKLKADARQDILTAAILHILKDYEMIEKISFSNPNVKRFCQQADRIIESEEAGRLDNSTRWLKGSQVLAVSEVFDNMTAMSLERTPESEVAAIKHLLELPMVYSPEVVQALMDSIMILDAGVCVELSTGEKALVLAENPQNILRPMVLCFRDNSILDLRSRSARNIEIKDIMKTMDNRHVMDTDMLKKYSGKKVEVL
ncbi:MAG: phosphohydrolase [Lachnospiraceae bacterium]|nr:phosphohydrolase [Lachnospiraceae bacterium]